MSHSTEFRRALASPPSRPRVDLEVHPLPASDVRRAAARPQPPRAGGQPAPSNPKRDRKRPRDDFTPEDDEAILRRAAEAAEAKSGQPWRRAAEKLFPGRGFSDKDLRERYKYLSKRKRVAGLPRSVVEEARFLARIRVVRLGVEWEGDFPKKVEDEWTPWASFMSMTDVAAALGIKVDAVRSACDVSRGCCAEGAALPEWERIKHVARGCMRPMWLCEPYEVFDVREAHGQRLAMREHLCGVSKSDWER